MLFPLSIKEITWGQNFAHCLFPVMQRANKEDDVRNMTMVCYIHVFEV